MTVSAPFWGKASISTRYRIICLNRTSETKRDFPVEFVRRIQNCGHVCWWDVSALALCLSQGLKVKSSGGGQKILETPLKGIVGSHTPIHTMGKVRVLSLNLTCLMWTPINSNKTKFFLVQATDPKLPLTRTQNNIFSSLCCNKLDDMTT